jgi:hypothetical protein
MDEPYWMPEVGLGMGRSRQVIGGIDINSEPVNLETFKVEVA